MVDPIIRNVKMVNGVLNTNSPTDDTWSPVSHNGIYHVVLNQTGTNDPVVKLVEYSIPNTVVTRSAVGTTLFTNTGAFPIGKCSPFTATVGYTAAGDKMVLTHVSDDVYKLETYAAVDTETLSDGVLVDQEIIIEVYKI